MSKIARNAQRRLGSRGNSVKMHNRVLFVSYHVPPRTGIATNRTSQLLRWLPKFGWEVIVLTPTLPGPAEYPNIIQTPMWDIKALLQRAQLGLGHLNKQPAFSRAQGARKSYQWIKKFAYAITAYPDREFGWLPFGTHRARVLLRDGTFDVILSSSLPVTAHFIARLARRGTAIPWVADLRDLWSEHHTLVNSKIRKCVDRLLEKNTLKSADVLVTVSEPFAEKLKLAYPEKRIVTIRNSFDEVDWQDVPFGVQPQCTLVYAGQFLWGKRDPRLLFGVVHNLLDSGLIDCNALRIEFYCPFYEWLYPLIRDFQLANVVRCNGVVPRKEVLLAERSADALLLVLWDRPAESGMYTGKFFEYVGARRPILAIGGPPSNVLDPLLSRLELGWRCRDQDSLSQCILTLIERRRAGLGPSVLPEPPEELSGRHMASTFAEIFASLKTSRTHTHPAPRQRLVLGEAAF
jgi:glycosyltransferase involved in cell wall biosynthesis